jgi:HxlR-like helix-turn-helix
VSDRLRTFCRMGVLETRLTSATSGRVDYRLTDKGRAFFPHVMVMLDWGDKWFRAPEGPATMLTHTSCGRQFRPVLHCSVCGLELHGSQIQVGGDPPKAAEPKAVPSVRLTGGLDGFGGGLDELRHLVGVRDHRYVTGLDFDGGCAHALGELALGVGRDGLIVLGHQVPGRA